MMKLYRVLRERLSDGDWRVILESPYALGLVLLVVTVLSLSMMAAIQVGTWQDDATFILMARALLEGKGMRLSYLVTEPVYPVVPVGYPILLAPLVFLFPGSLLPLRLLSTIFTLVTIVLVYRHARSRIGVRMALIIAGLVGTNMWVIYSGAQVMSEAASLLAIMGGVLLVDRFVTLQEVRWYDMALMAIVIGLPVTLRYLGAPITAAFALFILWRRRDRIAVYTVGIALVVFLFVNFGIGGEGVFHYYYRQLSGFLSRSQNTTISTSTTSGFAGNILAKKYHDIAFLLTYSIPGVLIPFFEGPQVAALFERLGLGFIPILALLAIDGLLIVGFIVQFRKWKQAAEWVVAFYAIALFLLPTNWETLASNYRYWIPLILFGYGYLLSGVQFFQQRLQKARHDGRALIRPGVVVLIFSLFMLALNLGRNVQAIWMNPWRSRVPDLDIGTDWLEAHTDADDVVMVVDRVRGYALYLDRPMLPHPRAIIDWETRIFYEEVGLSEEDIIAPNAFFDIIERFGVDYIFITPSRVPDRPLTWSTFVEDELLPTLELHSEQFDLVWESQDSFTRVYAYQP
ncbi:MAG TPA: hypothetical protein ENN32_02380 [Chloroflexi bacterium]|nr:hypothetical protein [Chloroflexota bacterium]